MTPPILKILSFLDWELIMLVIWLVNSQYVKIVAHVLSIELKQSMDL
jgi:hypothetical protein